MSSTNWWHAYECFKCGQIEGVFVHSLYFELNHSAENAPEACCPMCGEPAHHTGTWEADDHGYGASSEVPLLRRANTEAAARYDKLQDAVIEAYEALKKALNE